MSLSTNAPTVVTLARLAGITRICFGTAFIVAPRASARPWVGAGADSAGAQLLTRSMGVRDLLFGAGLLQALNQADHGPRRAGSATAPPPALSTQARPWRLPLASPRRSRVPALHHRRSRNRHAARSATPGPTTTNRTAHPREVHRRQMLAPPQNGNGHPRHEWRVMRSVPRRRSAGLSERIANQRDARDRGRQENDAVRRAARSCVMLRIRRGACVLALGGVSRSGVVCRGGSGRTPPGGLSSFSGCGAWPAHCWLQRAGSWRSRPPGAGLVETPQLVVSVSVISCQCAGQVPGGCVRLWWFGVPDTAENAAAFGFAG
jgi:hypothetical protein